MTKRSRKKTRPRKIPRRIDPTKAQARKAKAAARKLRRLQERIDKDTREAVRLLDIVAE